jgi:hypothetical protein
LQRRFADKVRLVELHGEIETGGERVDVFGQLVAVQRHGGFEAEGVPRAESAGFKAERLADFK